MKKFNKVIAAMMLMAITTAMPAMAGKTTVSTSRQNHNDRNDKAVVVNNHKNDSHFDRNEKTLPHLSAHNPHAYRPDVKSCKFVLSRRDYQKNVRAKVERMKGVMDTKWNPRTHELIVIYDAKVTSARHIKHFMA